MSENASFSFVAISVPAGPLLGGALSRRTSLQPRGQRCGGGGERPDRLRLQARFCGGSTTGRTTASRRVVHVCALLRAACVIPLSFSVHPERAEEDGPRQLGGPLPRWDRPRRAAVGANYHSEAVPAHTQSQDRLHGGDADWSTGTTYLHGHRLDSVCEELWLLC